MGMIEIRFLGEETRAAGLCLTSRPLQRMALLAKAPSKEKCQ
jgi:hypothetical protein